MVFPLDHAWRLSTNCKAVEELSFPFFPKQINQLSQLWALLSRWSLGRLEGFSERKKRKAFIPDIRQCQLMAHFIHEGPLLDFSYGCIYGVDLSFPVGTSAQVTKCKVRHSTFKKTWQKNMKRKQSMHIYVKENCWVLPHSTDADMRDLGRTKRKTWAWSSKIKCNDESTLRIFQNRKQNAQVVSKCQRNPQMTKNRGEQFKTGGSKID